MDRHFNYFWSSLWATLFAAVPAYAGDLTIMDSLGMSRAAKSGIGQAIVVVEAVNEGQAPILKNIDGLKADISGRWDEKSRSFKFDSVSPGTWQIQTKREIQKVQIISSK